MKIAFFSLLTIVFLSCNSGVNKLEGCYRINDGKYNVEMQISSQDNKVSGNLDYEINRKDKNTGTFHGTLNKDVIILDYTFQSEGMTSMRQVAFKKMGEELWEGYGEMKVEKDKVVFTDVSSITFGKGIVLKQQPCQQ